MMHTISHGTVLLDRLAAAVRTVQGRPRANLTGSWTTANHDVDAVSRRGASRPVRRRCSRSARSARRNQDARPISRNGAPRSARRRCSCGAGSAPGAPVRETNLGKITMHTLTHGSALLDQLAAAVHTAQVRLQREPDRELNVGKNVMSTLSLGAVLLDPLAAAVPAVRGRRQCEPDRP